ncbi:hypothetical protein V8E54_006258 [Elaphomyces granulatus]
MAAGHRASPQSRHERGETWLLSGHGRGMAYGQIEQLAKELEMPSAMLTDRQGWEEGQDKDAYLNLNTRAAAILLTASGMHNRGFVEDLERGGMGGNVARWFSARSEKVTRWPQMLWVSLR